MGRPRSRPKVVQKLKFEGLKFWWLCGAAWGGAVRAAGGCGLAWGRACPEDAGVERFPGGGSLGMAGLDALDVRAVRVVLD